ncbi:DUF3604 domain-containing protein [Parahaliea aestuarii]|uniref:DUF3604 domain-containing protein n=1 Tax=Parahaliea aestuarii TaxID=1852021 RepID=A0A5C8ZS36_9GAMM|nr:DUF3604 domain-containing protein [Parahaliea aestuarii]TXS90549.1 DUF3604 domain-containing protein [Parahaliea aestuarii]
MVIRIAALALLGAATAHGSCEDYSEDRQAWFGDLHVHTSYSQDANWRMGNHRIEPEDSYRFARGAAISLPPYDAQGDSPRELRLKRPLDFAAVTDHAEALGEVRLCSDPNYDGPGADSCGDGPYLRMIKRFASRVLPLETLCPPGDATCAAAQASVWRDTQAAAQSHNAPCEFTTFVGYEWSGLDGAANLHRNVIFRSEAVPSNPASAREARTPEQLWDALDHECRDGGSGCEAVTIPHNSNLSQGLMFSALLSSGDQMTSEQAQQRARYERLAEIVQHKGESECYGGPGAIDELCRFEKLPYSSFLQKYFSFIGEPPKDDSRYLREALREGLRLERQLGTNPFTTGFIGGTDTHLGAAGAVDEADNPGHHGAQHISGDGSAPQLPDRLEQNAGGLAVLYAEENTRDALFRAMQRREAYATSGPRIQLRFFGGWDYEDDLCERVDLVARGYAGGVPMGGELLREDSEGRAPEFILTAVSDPGTDGAPGGLLQRVQVVKAWVDSAGESREEVYEVAGSPGNGAGVDLQTCQPRGNGYQRLCSVWRDPDFDAALGAVYYSRVVENPSCRWQQQICVANRVNCANPDAVAEPLQGCCDDSVPRTIQERAWSSPIWYRAS